MFKIGDRVKTNRIINGPKDYYGAITYIEKNNFYDIATVRFDDGHTYHLFVNSISLASEPGKCECGSSIPKDRMTCCDCSK